MNLMSQILEKLAHKLDEALPDDLRKSMDRVEKKLRAFAESTFQRMDLVTRKEFDAQSEMLSQSQLRVKELKERIKELEGKASSTTGRRGKT